MQLDETRGEEGARKTMAQNGASHAIFGVFR